MKYQVVIAESAIEGAMEAYAFIHADSPERASGWFDGLLAAIGTLEEYPKRCKMAPEAETLGEDVRQLLYGAYRVLFIIQDREVRVFHVRHSSRTTFDHND